jgi:tetratricopeptide (TPR) repeat protein
MIPRLFKVCLACSVFAASLHAQKQGGGAPPAPPPPPPSNAPTRNPTAGPDPTANPVNQPQTQGLTLRGRIITDGSELPVSQLEVRFESDGGPPLGFAYADSSGQFTFHTSAVSADQTLYIAIQLDGYKPFREQIGGVFGMTSLDSTITVFLERETTIRIDKSGPSIVDLRQLRTKVPSKAVDEYEKALKESSKGNTGKAIEGLERAIKLAPDFYEAQNSLGAQFLRMQKYDDAETTLLRAKELGPKAAEPLINLGMLYYQRGETQGDAGQAEQATATFQKAVESLEESVKRNPLSALAHSFLGAALYKIASYERAELMLNRALELDDQQQDARLMLINVYTKGKRFKEALDLIKIYLLKNPAAPQRAALEGIRKQLEQALAK